MNYGGIRRVPLGLILLTALLLVGTVRLVQSEGAVDTAARMPRQTLVIDPGHGGEDGGAVSVSGRKESELNLAIALRLDRILGFYGVDTLLTRSEDVSIHDGDKTTLREKKVSDLHNRVRLIQGVEQATLISIHQNSYPESRYRGTQVFYGDDVLSRPLAETIQDHIREQIDPSNTRRPQRIPASIYLLNHISCRAVLVECGFLSNPEEDRLLQQASYQRKLALVLAASCLQSGDTQEGEGFV